MPVFDLFLQTGLCR